MRFTPFAWSCCALLSLALFCPRSDAQQEPEYGIGKIARYTQTGNGAPSALASAPYLFAADASSMSTVNGPASAYAIVSTLTNSGFYETTQTFASQAQMDAVYPSGTYTFTVTNQPQFKATITGDLYPPFPRSPTAPG